MKYKRSQAAHLDGSSDLTNSVAACLLILNGSLTPRQQIPRVGKLEDWMIAEEFCPVSDDLLGRLYRASPEGLAVLVKTVAPATRAALAYYCSRRAHLEQIGFVIATTCLEQDLYNHAGRAGLDLFARATAQEPQPDAADGQSKRGTITLAAAAPLTPLSS